MCPVLAPALPERPYPGIEAFDYADHAVFFARDEESDRLLRQVTVYRGVLVYGPSGAGKSSLINAGFVPRALAEGFTPDRIRLQPRAGQEIIVERIAVNAQGRPPYLPSNFAFENDTAGGHVLSIREFREKLAVEPDSDRVPILIFDQFEEFVSLFEEAPRGEALQVARQVQNDLLDLIVALHRDAGLRIKLIFVFREDYLAKLGKVFNRCPDLRDIFLHLTAPRTAALEQIILGPFRYFPNHFAHKFPETLARQLQLAFEERSDSTELNLSEVQIACQRVWLSIDPEREFAQKGLQGLLEDYLAESLGLLHPDLRDPAVALLSRMVTDGGLRNVISEDDLIARALNEEGIRRDRLQAALRSLVADTRLVRRERREDVVFLEIVSEFLVPWIGRQRAARLSRSQRNRWIVAAAALLFIALASLGATLWVLRNRTEAAIARDEVRIARGAQDAARSEALAAQRTRAEAEARLARAAAEKDALVRDGQSMRMTLARVRPQQVLQAEVERLTADAVRLRAENSRIVQKLRAADETIARQRADMDALRNRLAAAVTSTGNRRVPLAIPSQSKVMAGKVRAGELTVLTGPPPFNAGLACFILESDPASSVHSELAVVATTDDADTWKKNRGKASNELRAVAKLLFQDPATANLPNRIDRQLRQMLPGILGIHNLIWTGARATEAPHSVIFEFKNATYELVLIPRSPRDFDVTVSRIGSLQP